MLHQIAFNPSREAEPNSDFWLWQNKPQRSDSVRKSSWEAQQIYLQVQTGYGNHFPRVSHCPVFNTSLKSSESQRTNASRYSYYRHRKPILCLPRAAPCPATALQCGMAQPLPLLLLQLPQQQHRDSSPFPWSAKVYKAESVRGNSREKHRAAPHTGN